MEVVDTTIGEDAEQLSIGPLGVLLVVMSALIGLALFLDPSSSSYDISVGGIIVLGVAIAFSSLIQRTRYEVNLRNTLLLALIGGAIISITATLVYTVPLQSTVQGQILLIVGLPPIFEELIFRVMIFLAVYRVTHSMYAATIIQAVFFALYHFVRQPDLAYLIVLFIGGIVLQWIFILSKNILSSMLAHAMGNLRPYLLELVMSPLGILTIGGALLIVLLRRRLHG